MTIDTILSHFNSYLPLGDEDRQALASRVTERHIKRRQFILQEGYVCRHYSFVVSGCFKMYGVDAAGKEHIIQFAVENEWIADIGSFHTEKPSRLFIEALEPAVIIQIEKPSLLYLYTHHTIFNRIFRVIIEDNFVAQQNRLLQEISATAEERYLSFLTQHPSLSNRLPNTQIASYLGITPEFLSKIRNNIATGK